MPTEGVIVGEFFLQVWWSGGRFTPSTPSGHLPHQGEEDRDARLNRNPRPQTLSFRVAIGLEKMLEPARVAHRSFARKDAPNNKPPGWEWAK
jgi:hypothetical protein